VAGNNSSLALAQKLMNAVHDRDPKVPFTCRSIGNTAPTTTQIKAGLPQISKNQVREAAVAASQASRNSIRASSVLSSAPQNKPPASNGEGRSSSFNTKSTGRNTKNPWEAAGGAKRDSVKESAPPPPPPSIRNDLPLEPPIYPETIPSRKDSAWNIGKYSFRADFDSANLAKIQPVPDAPGEFEVWTVPDNGGNVYESAHRTWFYFGAKGFSKGDTATFSIMNLNRQSKLYNHDMRPVYRAHPSMNRWDRIMFPVSFQNTDDDEQERGFKLTFKHKFDSSEDEEVFFAFCEPYSVADQAACLERIEAELARDTEKAEKIYYKRECLCYSLQRRKLDLITITSHDGASTDLEDRLPGLFPDTTNPRPPIFQNKKVFFISSRVHPGETPASHMFNGILGFLLRSKDPRAIAARKHFVFKLIPILNPDGVSLGHYRMDTLGRNLNRFYDTPSPEEHPTIHAVRSLILDYAEKSMLDIYIDLHAHANKRGCFLFGNALEGPQQVENVLLAKLAAINCPYFDFNGCDFTEKNMCMKDRRDPQVSKEGSGRVALYRATGITHIYTCETNYNTSRIHNIIAPVKDPKEIAQEKKEAAVVDKAEAATARRNSFLASRLPSNKDKEQVQNPEISRHASPPSRSRDPIKFGAEEFAQMGRTLVIAALDLREVNPWSRIPNTEFRNLGGVRTWVSSCLRSAATRKEIRASIRAAQAAARDEDD